MRNLECDFSPHLIVDWHPYWATYFTQAAPDESAANPWYHHDDSGREDNRDNHYLYYKPADSQKPSAVLEGTLNPPGTWSHSGSIPGWLLGLYGILGPFGWTGSTTYSVDAAGIGDVAGGPDVIPDSQSLGERYNCERGNELSNLQTFLAVNQPPPAPPESAAPTVRQPPSPAAVDYVEALRKLIERKLQR
jgi:hypothetical protein